MIKKLTLVLSITALAGCVSTKTIKIDQTHSDAMHGKTMAVTASDKPNFGVMTVGKVMFGLVGAVAMISEGNKIIKTYDVADPAEYIGESIAAKISDIHSVSIEDSVIAESDGGVDALAEKYLAKDFILDVRTINWSFGYFPTDWNSYRVMYSVKLRLIDTSTREVVAESFCARIPVQTPESPSYDQLLENGAERLKSDLRVEAEYCINEFQNKIL